MLPGAPQRLDARHGLRVAPPVGGPHVARAPADAALVVVAPPLPHPRRRIRERQLRLRRLLPDRGRRVGLSGVIDGDVVAVLGDHTRLGRVLVLLADTHCGPPEAMSWCCSCLIVLASCAAWSTVVVAFGSCFAIEASICSLYGPLNHGTVAACTGRAPEANTRHRPRGSEPRSSTSRIRRRWICVERDRLAP